MKNMKIIKILTILIVVLSAFAAMIGLFSCNKQNYIDIITSFGEKVELYNKGIYARDSVSMASQAVAQDFITLTVGIPMILVSLYFIHRRKTKGLFLLTGTLAYFLYTYTSYSVLITYNPLYLVYLVLMSSSFYAFILCMKGILEDENCSSFSDLFPVRALSNFLLITGFVLGGRWLVKVVPTILSNKAPFGLEQYPTLGIQSLDLGFIVPASFVSAYLLRKKNKWGYVLSIVLVNKAVTMTAAVSAMAFLMKLNGVNLGVFDLAMFPILFTMCAYCLVKLLLQFKDSKF